MVGTLVMAPKSVTFRRHDHLVSVLFGDLLSHSYNITFSMFLYLLYYVLAIYSTYCFNSIVFIMVVVSFRLFIRSLVHSVCLFGWGLSYRLQGLKMYTLS